VREELVGTDPALTPGLVAGALVEEGLAEDKQLGAHLE
jgi:hypothetical protein